MLRFILLSLAFIVTTTVFAQKEVAFLDKNQLEWLDREVADLNAAVTLLETGRADDNSSTINEASRKIKRSFMTLTSTGLRMYERLAVFVDPAKLAEKHAPPVGDNSVSNYELELKRNRRIRNLEELSLTAEEVDSFLENISEIKDLSDVLAVHNYDFNSKALKDFEIKSVRTALDAAKANNNLVTVNVK